MPTKLYSALPEISSGLTRRYLGGFSRTLLGTIASQASAYFSILLAARLLGVEGFGRLGAVQSALTAVFAASVLGIGITATRYVARCAATDSERAGRILGLCALVSLVSGLVFSCFLALLAGRIATNLLRVPDLAWAIRATAPYCVLMTLNTHQTGALLGFEAYRRLMRVQIWQATSSFALTILLITTFGFKGAVISLPLSAAAACWFAHRELSRECRCRSVRTHIHGIWSERAVLAGFTLPASLSALAGNAAIWSAQAMLVRTAGGVEQMGLWTTAVALRQVVLFAPAVLNRAAGPILASLHDEGSTGSYPRALWMHTLVATGAAGAAGSLILLLQTPLLRAFGSGYVRATAIVPLAIVSAVAEAFACSLYQAVFADAHMHLQLLIGGAWSAVLVGSAWWGVASGGGYALARAYWLAWCTSALGYGVVALYQTRHYGRTLRLAAVALEAQ